MKYKIGALIMVIALLSVTAMATAADSGSDNNRYHQHLEAAVPSGPCTCDGSELCTHLPIIRIDTDGQYIPGEIIFAENGETVLGYTTADDGSPEIAVTIETIEGEGQWHHASDEATYSSTALFRIRGNSSRNFPKKNYRIKLVTDETGLKSNSLPLLGMGAENDWALHGPFLDKTLMRNYMWMNISAEIMGYAPNVRFCEVILNGEYQGVYVLMETIKEDEYRVDLSDYEPGSAATSYILLMDAADEGVLIENYTWYTQQLEFNEVARTGIQVIYPQEEYLSEDVVSFIQRDVSRLERGLYSSDMVIGKYGYSAEIDVGSFVDYYILQEFLANNDAFSRSTYFYRDVRGKLTLGPVWDYNNVLNNYFYDFSHSGFLLANRSWYGRMMTDETFVRRVIARYRELREGVLSDEYLVGYINDVVEYLGDAIERNDEVWGYSYNADLLGPNQRREPDSNQTLEDVNPESHEQAVGWMTGYMLARGEWMDEHIEDLLQYCHPSKTASQAVE